MGGLKYSGWWRDNQMHSHMLRDSPIDEFTGSFGNCKDLGDQGMQTRKVITRRYLLE
jgi:antitoxin component YwqK of YwqJK toxin-antitoxin module